MGLKIGFFFNSALPNLIIKDKFFKNLLGICGGLLKTLLSMISLLNKSSKKFYIPNTIVLLTRYRCDFFSKGLKYKAIFMGF